MHLPASRAGVEGFGLQAKPRPAECRRFLRLRQEVWAPEIQGPTFIQKRRMAGFAEVMHFLIYRNWGDYRTTLTHL